MDDRMVLDAIIKANKLGAKGIQVVSFLLPQTSDIKHEIILVTKIPESGTSFDKPWYDR